MNVIDQAAKRFANMEIKASSASNDMQALHKAAKETFEQMSKEVANTDAKMQTLHDECARLFQECSGKLGETKVELGELQGHLKGHPPPDWHIKADQTMMDI